MCGAAYDTTPIWTWPDGPRQFTVAASAALSVEHQAAAIAAVTWWNEQVGAPLLRYSPQAAPDFPMIFVDYYLPRAGGADGYALQWSSQRGCTAIVQPGSRTFDRTLRHEIGHCLGLAHNPASDSVMYSHPHAGPYGVLPEERAWVRATFLPEVN